MNIKQVINGMLVRLKKLLTVYLYLIYMKFEGLLQTPYAYI